MKFTEHREIAEAISEALNMSGILEDWKKKKTKSPIYH